jgi:hypothetical protein
VHFRGNINNPTQSSAQFATLPVAFRPQVDLSMRTALFGGQGNGAIAIWADGSARAFGASAGQVSLDGVTYSLH